MFLSYAPSLSEPVAGARGPRGEGGDEKGEVTCCRAEAAALKWEDGTVIRASRWLELSWTA